MTLLIFVLLLPILLVTIFFVIEVLAGIWPLASKAPVSSHETVVAIIVPAHDEALVIGDTLAELVKAANQRCRIVLVADNCSDTTADVARSYRIEVLERYDPSKRGKGFALDFAREYLRAAPPDVTVVLDADCKIGSQSLNALVATCMSTREPCQAVNLLSPAPHASPFVQISTFAFCLKNLVRQRALQRLAGRVHLTGTGMAFPWGIFDLAQLATGNIVEDLNLGIELAEQGHRCQLLEEARVWSAPAAERATLVQRQRWEGGFIGTVATAAPRSLRHALGAADLRAVCAALDLFIPPVALLVLLNLAALGCSVVAAVLIGAHWWPVILQGVVALLAGVVILLAWFFEGRPFISLLGLAKMPIYLVRKLALYASLLRGGAPKEWLRTERIED